MLVVVVVLVVIVVVDVAGHRRRLLEVQAVLVLPAHLIGQLMLRLAEMVRLRMVVDVLQVVVVAVEVVGSTCRLMVHGQCGRHHLVDVVVVRVRRWAIDLSLVNQLG